MTREFNEYLDLITAIQKNILKYIDSEDNVEENYQNLVEIFNDHKILCKSSKLKIILHLINQITKDHYRFPSMFKKISQILRLLFNEIDKTLSVSDIYEIFKDNKKIILIIIEEKLLKEHDQFIIEILRNEKLNEIFFQYFLPEFKQYINDDRIKKELTEEQINQCNTLKLLKDFEEKRRIGENDEFICDLIRRDLVNEFISYVTCIGLPLTMTIKPSIYETNPFLIKNNPSLIEYAAFFGSIQIFKYLISQKVKLTSSLWLYAIHCPNSFLISVLEENHIEPEDQSYEKCLEEAIKCHHSEFTLYIIDKYIGQKKVSYNIKNNFSKNIVAYGFRYYNFFNFPNDINYKYFIFYACQYGYEDLVDILLMNKHIDVNATVVMTQIFFFL